MGGSGFGDGEVAGWGWGVLEAGKVPRSRAVLQNCGGKAGYWREEVSGNGADRWLPGDSRARSFSSGQVCGALGERGRKRELWDNVAVFLRM